MCELFFEVVMKMKRQKNLFSFAPLICVYGLISFCFLSLSSCNEEQFYRKKLEIQQKGSAPTPTPEGEEKLPPPPIPVANKPPVAEGTAAPTDGEEDKEHLIVLKYTDSDGDKATSCRIEGVRRLSISTPCSCDARGEQGSNCRVGLTGEFDYYGEVSFRYSVRAGGLDSGVSPAISYSLANVADRPVGTGGLLQGAAREDEELRVHLNFFDVDGDRAKSCQINTSDLSNLDSTRCSCEGSDETGYCVARLRGNLNFHGAIQFDYTVTTENSGLRNAATSTSFPKKVNLTLESVNDAPVAQDGNGGKHAEESQFSVDLNYADVDSLAHRCEVRSPQGEEKLSFASCSCDSILGNCSVTVTGKPEQFGSTSFDFRVQDSVGNRWSNWATISLSLTETLGICGRENPIDRVEEFTQNASSGDKVDILWVVDNSGSMSNDQKVLAQTFDSFIDNFIKQKIDFQMGITTTSGYTGSDVSADFKKLNAKAARKDEDQFKTDFRELIKVGTKGSNTEKGLGYSRKFLEENKSWLRSDALLVIVYLSDEDDQSRKRMTDPHGEKYVDIFINFLKGLKTEGKSRIQVYSIVNQPGDGSSVGDRYIKVSRAFDPKKQTVASIKPDKKCTKNGRSVSKECHARYLSSVLSDFGGKILKLLNSFVLKGNPVEPKKIKVSVEGTLRAEKEWSYDFFRKKILFKESYIPSESSRIAVSYQECPVPSTP